ncbi:MAG: ATP-binding protein [Candidatus Riflebacteria bacterium]|nr:ATP-binding protein [Candidatus Riflebacteria bacterium]
MNEDRSKASAHRKPGRRGAPALPPLCPTQRASLDRLLALWPCSDVFVLWARSGLGRTTVLRTLAGEVPGSLVMDVSKWFLAMRREHPLQLEEAFVEQAIAQLKRCDALLVDDLDRITCPFGECNHYYPRRGLDRPALLTLLDVAARLKKKLVFTDVGKVNEVVDARCLYVGWDRLTVEDYRTLFDSYLGAKGAGVDLRRVFEFASKLTMHQIRGSLDVLKREEGVTTERVLTYLEQLKMASNVHVSSIRPVALEDLKGVDDVLEGLHRYIINPLQEQDLARKYAVRLKRGILLFGPPGTGKTTVGRALAHRLRSKFFRIDGTFITRTSSFYQRVSRVFEAAKDNAPSLIFIDDCDTIFEDNDEFGLYRYLLTMLDGLESEDMAGVSVMMTAMNVASLPPALIRSGRIELWLEMKKPDQGAREQILAGRVTGLPGLTGNLDLTAVAAATEGFTGADLNRLAEDAKAFLLEELTAGRPIDELTRFFLMAAEEVRRNIEIVQAATREAEARAIPRMPDPFARFRSWGSSDGDENPPGA